MDEIFYLVLIAMFMLGAFAMTVLRMWIVTHQDVKLGQRVNGLSIDVGKIKKQLRDGNAGVVKQLQQDMEIPMDMSSMTLESAAEMLGFDKKELSNPIFRPIAEKIFEAFKAKAVKPDNEESQIEML